MLYCIIVLYSHYSLLQYNNHYDYGDRRNIFCKFEDETCSKDNETSVTYILQVIIIYDMSISTWINEKEKSNLNNKLK